jgi:hypothetical protein
VGSEMCIRDRLFIGLVRLRGIIAAREAAKEEA